MRARASILYGERFILFAYKILVELRFFPPRCHSAPPDDRRRTAAPTSPPHDASTPAPTPTPTPTAPPGPPPPPESRPASPHAPGRLRRASAKVAPRNGARGAGELERRTARRLLADRPRARERLDLSPRFAHSKQKRTYIRAHGTHIYAPWHRSSTQTCKHAPTHPSSWSPPSTFLAVSIDK